MECFYGQNKHKKTQKVFSPKKCAGSLYSRALSTEMILENNLRLFDKEKRRRKSDKQSYFSRKIDQES